MVKIQTVELLNYFPNEICNSICGMLSDNLKVFSPKNHLLSVWFEFPPPQNLFWQWLTGVVVVVVDVELVVIIVGNSFHQVGEKRLGKFSVFLGKIVCRQAASESEQRLSMHHRQRMSSFDRFFLKTKEGWCYDWQLCDGAKRQSVSVNFVITIIIDSAEVVTQHHHCSTVICISSGFVL